jgi:hypothetical protein
MNQDAEAAAALASPALHVVQLSKLLLVANLLLMSANIAAGAGAVHDNRSKPLSSQASAAAEDPECGQHLAAVVAAIDLWLLVLEQL